MTDDPERPGKKEKEKPQSVLRTVIRIAVLVLVIYLLWGIFSAIDWAQVADAIANLSAANWVRLILLTLVYYAAEAFVLMAARPGLKFSHGLIAFLAPSAAATIIPGPSDLVARFAMYSGWGFSANDTTASVMTSWVFTTFTKIALPILGAIALATFGRGNADLETIAIIAAAVILGAFILLMLLLRSEQLARTLGYRAGELAQRLAKPFNIETPQDLAETLSEGIGVFRETVGALLRRRWYLGFPAALATQLVLFGLLLTSLRGVGITAEQLHWAEIFAAFTLVQVITIIPIMPGGIGIAEAAYVTILVGQSNRQLADTVVAGTLVYRIFSWLLILPFGGLAWLLWKRNLQDEEAAAEAPAPGVTD